MSVKKILSNGRSRWRHERSEFFIQTNYNIKFFIKNFIQILYYTLTTFL
ncbi:hypothetical protein [Romboutsia ilealis]|nr:hypothetical protein [Romboutsia ilealis]